MAGFSGMTMANPNQLKDKVPTENVKEEQDDVLASVLAAAPAEINEGGDDDVLSSVTVPQEEMVEEPTFRSQDTFLTANLTEAGRENQLLESGVRIAASLAKTPESIRLTLENKLGKDNYLERNGKFYFRFPGEKDFRALDQDTIEIYNDIFADNYKMWLQMVGGIAGAKAGATGGAVVSGPLAAGGAILGGILGGGFGAAAGGAYAEGPAASEFGVVRAPEDQRNVVERTQEELGEGVMFALGDGLGRFIPGAWKWMKNALRRGGDDVAKATGKASEELVGRTAKIVDDVAENARILKENGIDLAQNEAAMVLSPGQILGTATPEGKALDKVVSGNQAVREFFVNQGKLLDDGYGKLIETVTKKTGRPVEELYGLAKEAVKSERKIVGSLIGDFRKQALNMSGGKPFDMPISAKALPEITQRFGFRFAEGKAIAPNAKMIKQMFPDASPEVAEEASKLIGKFYNKIGRKGKLSLKETDELYKELDNFVATKWGTKSGGGVAYEMAKVRRAIRDDWADQIGAVLGEGNALTPGIPGARKAYESALKDFRSIVQSQENLANILRADEMSASSFAHTIFSRTKGKQNVKALKNLIKSTDPELWDDLVARKLEMMVDAARIKGTKAIGEGADDFTRIGSIDWKKLNDSVADLKQYGILDQMFDPKQRVLFERFMNIAGRVPPNMKFVTKELAGSKGFLQWARDLVVSFATGSNVAKAGAAERIMAKVVGGMGEDKALAKWLKNEGLEIILKDLPAAQRGATRTLWNNILEKSLQMTSLEKYKATKQAERQNKKLTQQVK